MSHPTGLSSAPPSVYPDSHINYPGPINRDITGFRLNKYKYLLNVQQVGFKCIINELGFSQTITDINLNVSMKNWSSLNFTAV